MTKVNEAKAALWGQLVDSGELDEDDANNLLDNLVEAAKEEEHESIFGKTQEVHFSDGVNGWTGMLTTELPAFPKTEEGKFYLNTDHIKIIPTRDTKAG